MRVNGSRSMFNELGANPQQLPVSELTPFKQGVVDSQDHNFCNAIFQV